MYLFVLIKQVHNHYFREIERKENKIDTYLHKTGGEQETAAALDLIKLGLDTLVFFYANEFS